MNARTLEIVTWNIQNGRGMDGRVDLARVARTVLAAGISDVICLQEVVRHMPGLTDGDDVDQAAELARLFEGFRAVYRPAVDFHPAAGKDHFRQFGCMILSRLPVLQILNHLLPRPASPETKSIQRQVLEVVVEGPGGPLRIATTHLEFFQPEHRMAQVRRIRDLHRDAWGAQWVVENMAPSDTPYAPVPRPGDQVLCGDFNFLPESRAYTDLIAEFDAATPPLVDTWTLTHPGTPHPHSFGADLAGNETAANSSSDALPPGPHCRDYVFVTPAVAERISSLSVDMETRASDHQPMRLTTMW
jgi:endonuclease/exonuclease/phosphatase family metal-dependent hydrolase